MQLPGQMSHSSGIFYCLRISTATSASCLHFTAMASSFLPSQDFQAGTPLPHAACDQQLSDTTQGKQRTPHFMPQTPVPLGWHCQACLPVWNRHWPLRITLARTLSFSCFLSISFCKMKAQLGGVWAWHDFLCPSVEQESP